MAKGEALELLENHLQSWRIVVRLGVLFWKRDWINPWEFEFTSKCEISIEIANSRPCFSALNSAWLFEEQWNPQEKPSFQLPFVSLKTPPAPPRYLFVEKAPSILSLISGSSGGYHLTWCVIVVGGDNLCILLTLMNSYTTLSMWWSLDVSWVVFWMAFLLLVFHCNQQLKAKIELEWMFINKLIW